MLSSSSVDESSSKSNKVLGAALKKTFNIYVATETDLDQPTNYSLRYAEDSDSDSDNHERNKQSGFQDTVKTYCTEDTPYETPFNFSTSTSMSDLRLDVKHAEEDNVEKRKDAENVIEVGADKAEGKSDEKPVNYCEEGTPGFLSRGDSFGSLNSVNDTAKIKKSCIEKGHPAKLKGQTETKAVKFEDVVNYAEETPLMFSRSSSLSSLDSIEQHSIQDDRSSLVSDLSRLTSGLVSPSELPDSPSQTIPTSPKPGTVPVFKMNKTDDMKNTVFEDNVTKFKTEHTPIQFSSATSLSSLTIDDLDEPDTKKPANDNVTIKEEEEEEENDLLSEEGEEDENMLAACITMGMQMVKIEDTIENCKEKEDEDVLSEDEEDDDILAACINIGMQKNRYSEAVLMNSPHQNVSSSSTDKVVENSPVVPNLDSTKTFYTEGTPAILSHAGSNSDLSVLSMTGTDLILSDIESNISDDDLLAECIQSAMPKSTKTERASSSRKSSVASSINYDDDDDKDLLKECILSGMLKNQDQQKTENLPEKCIREMPKQKTKQESSDFNDIQYEILKERLRNVAKKPQQASTSDLTDAERVLLQQCIISGMRKNKTAKVKPKASPPQQTNRCCIHCPMNKSHGKLKKKSKVQFRERTDVLCVTSQVVSVKKELVYNPREEWI